MIAGNDVLSFRNRNYAYTLSAASLSCQIVPIWLRMQTTMEFTHTVIYTTNYARLLVYSQTQNEFTQFAIHFFWEQHRHTHRDQGLTTGPRTNAPLSLALSAEKGNRTGGSTL